MRAGTQDAKRKTKEQRKRKRCTIWRGILLRGRFLKPGSPAFGLEWSNPKVGEPDITLNWFGSRTKI
jgi:hypothetical protein